MPRVAVDQHAGRPIEHAADRLGGVLLRDGTTLKCQCHGSRFDIRTGKALCAPAEGNLKVFELKAEGNDLMLKV